MTQTQGLVFLYFYFWMEMAFKNFIHCWNPLPDLIFFKIDFCWSIAAIQCC